LFGDLYGPCDHGLAAELTDVFPGNAFASPTGWNDSHVHVNMISKILFTTNVTSFVDKSG